MVSDSIVLTAVFRISAIHYILFLSTCWNLWHSYQNLWMQDKTSIICNSC